MELEQFEQLDYKNARTPLLSFMHHLMQYIDRCLQVCMVLGLSHPAFTLVV